MSINPETLQEDTEEERKERQRRTGSLGSGLTVICTPNPEDPDVQEVQHRVVCAMRPYAACYSCQHRIFTLTFKGDPDRYEQVLCPMWKNVQERLDGKQPDEYLKRELAMCAEKPFEFCASCPSREELAKMGIDKTKDGWYARYRRFKQEQEAEEDD